MTILFDHRPMCKKKRWLNKISSYCSESKKNITYLFAHRPRVYKYIDDEAVIFKKEVII